LWNLLPMDALGSSDEDESTESTTFFFLVRTYTGDLAHRRWGCCGCRRRKKGCGAGRGRGKDAVLGHRKGKGPIYVAPALAHLHVTSAAGCTATTLVPPRLLKLQLLSLKARACMLV
jgi:hypothetical protein